jgi:hypothetical protein
MINTNLPIMNAKNVLQVLYLIQILLNVLGVQKKNAKLNQPIIAKLVMYLHMIMDVLNVMQTNMNICRLIIRKLNVKFAKMDIYLIIFVISIILNI